jgi:hypothetical protein
MKWPKLLNLFSCEEEKNRIYLRDFNFIESRMDTVRYNQNLFDRFIDRKDYRLNLVYGFFIKVL